MAVPIRLTWVVGGADEAAASAKNIGQAISNGLTEAEKSASASAAKITAILGNVGKLAGSGFATQFAAQFSAGFEAVLRQAEARAKAISGLAGGSGGSRGAAGGQGSHQHTDAVNQQIRQTTGLATRMWQSIAGHGSPASQTLNVMLTPLKAIQGSVGAIDRAWTSVGNNMMRVSAIFYSIDRIGSLLQRSTLGPLERIMDATADSRKFETSIAGIVGGMGNAHAVNQSLEAIGPNSPLGLNVLRQIGTEISKVGPLAQQMAFMGPVGASSTVGGYASIIGQLQAMNPDRTSDEISRSLGQALLGQGRGLRTQVMIDPDQLAQMVGHRSSQDFRGNPDLLLRALQQYVGTFAPQGALNARQNLPEVQMQHIRDQLQVALEKIGDSGVFDQVVDRLKHVADGLFDYVGSPEYQSRAQSISQSLGHLLDNLFDASARFLKGLTGAPDVEKSADGVVGGVDRLVHMLSEASDQLPNFAERAGNAVQSLTHWLDYMITRIEGAANHPLDAAGDAMVGDDNLRRANAIYGDMRGMGLRGMQVVATHPDMSQYANMQPWDYLAKNWTRDRQGRPVDGMGNLVADQVTGYTVDTSRMSGSQRTLADQVMSQLQGVDTTDILKRGVRGVIGSSVDLSSLGGGSGGTRTAAASLPNDDALRAQLKLLNDAIMRLGGGMPEHSKFSELSDEATSAYDSISRTMTPDASSELQSGNMASLIRQGLARQLNRYNNRINALDHYGNGSTGLDSFLNLPTMAALAAHRDALSDGVNAQLNGMNGQLASSVAKYGASASMAVDGKSPAAAADFIGRAIAGHTDLANRAAGDTGLSASAFGLTAMPGSMQPEVMRRYVEMQISSIKGMGAAGNLPGSPSLASALTGTPSTGQMETQVYQQALQNAQQQFKNAQDQYVKNPTDEARYAMVAAAEEVTNYTGKLHEAQESTNQAMQAVIGFGNSVQHTLESTLGNVFDSLLTKSKNLKDVLQQMARGLVSDFSQSSAGAIFGSLFGSPNGKAGAGNGIGGLLGGLFASSPGNGSLSFGHTWNAGSSSPGANGDPHSNGGAAGSAGGLLGVAQSLLMHAIMGGGGSGGADFGAYHAQMFTGADGSDFGGPAPSSGGGADFGSVMPTDFAANGAVWRGGFTAFARGGIASKPTIGLVGERPDGIPEAIIPMTHGGKIPLGSDGANVFAMLPGGRKVPAGFAFAHGGIAAGGFSGRDLSSAAGTSIGAGMGGGGGGVTHVTIYTVANHEEAMQRGYSAIRGHILHEMHWAARPGGTLRRTLSRPN